MVGIAVFLRKTKKCQDIESDRYVAFPSRRSLPLGFFEKVLARGMALTILVLPILYWCVRDVYENFDAFKETLLMVGDVCVENRIC